MKKQLYLFGGTRPTFPNLCNVNKHINQMWKMARKHPKGNVSPISWVSEEVTALPCQTRWWMLASICHHWHPETLRSSHGAVYASCPTFFSVAESHVTSARCPNIWRRKNSHFLLVHPSCIRYVKCFWQWQRKTATLSSRRILLLRLWQHWWYYYWLYGCITVFFAGCGMLEKFAGASPWGI